MKKLILIIILLGAFNIANAQCLSVINGSKNMYSYNSDNSTDIYLNASINTLKVEDPGVDFDLEAGIQRSSFVLYAFYGIHNRTEYTNYGGGVDYNIINLYPVKLYLGGNIGGISTPDPNTIDPVHRLAYAFRSKALFNITNDIGITLVGQYQQRPDKINYGIFELNAGLQIYLN